MIEVLRHREARDFLARAESWLARSEIENGVALGSARQARADDSRYQKPVYWATIEQDGEIIGCAYRTPPYRLGITAVPEAAIAPLVANVETVYESLSGVSGPEPTASQFAAAWAARRGSKPVVVVRQRLYAFRPDAATAEASPRVPGELRLARPGDAALARTWGAAFLAETGLTHVDAAVFDEFIRSAQLYFWVDTDARCMAATIRRTAHGAAIGVLYTPGNGRRHDFGRATLAALTQTLRAQGFHDCYLYADPVNRGAAAVAERVGYRPVHDGVDIDLR
jgi:GNAT superfamily N-acetyltransferase